MNKYLRYYHTLRYIPLRQSLKRAWFKFYRPKPDLKPAPTLRSKPGGWFPAQTRLPLMLSPHRFRFLNEEHEVRTAADWNNPAFKMLWRYNLHYFEDLFARGAETRKAWHRELIQRWIAENPPGYGVGWDPYPLSLRICNWIKWALAGNDLNAEVLHSLAVQTRYLRKRHDAHLLGNHLLVNGKAFIFAGLFFEGAEAEGWLAKGMQIFNEQIPEQILDDGGHFERSPMYQNLITEDLLDVFNLFSAYHRHSDFHWLVELERMRRWSWVMTHPDGQIVLFNDAAFGIAPIATELDSYAEALGLPAIRFPAESVVDLHSTGYLRAQLGPALLFADCAPLGPDYLPGHGHADTLSFELSLAGKRLVVDSGTSIYEICPERLRQRGTSAHNTVQVDGQDSSEVWASFRVARRAKVCDVQLLKDNERVRLEAEHAGFRRLPGVGSHKRTWELTKSGLTITDVIEGKGQHDVQIAYHFHPEVGLSSLNKNSIMITFSEQKVAEFVLDPKLNVSLEDCTYHPEFGRSVRNQKLTCRYQGSLPVSFTCSFAWFLH